MIEPTFQSWRAQARVLIGAGLRPESVQFLDRTDQASLFPEAPPVSGTREFTVPKAFMALAEFVACARHQDRWDLLYRLLFRIAEGDHDLLQRLSHSDVARANDLAKSVKRDIHKMHAFVRFKAVEENTPRERYVAWHKPEHYTLRMGAPFFERRFGDKPWTIFTPDESAHWDGGELTFGTGALLHEFQHGDDLDGMWKSYYKSIFNPARIKLKAMRAEMAPKYWSSMPETELIHELVRQAPARLQKMAEDQYQAAKVPPGPLMDVRGAASACQACPIHHLATQTVFGAGPETAELMILGEQPGDEEDLTGTPFSGPAGEILNEALVRADLRREELYITNAVKHFKFEWRGKTRLHRKPTGREAEACRPWLEAEILRVRPKAIVALGATAGTALLGRLPSVAKERGVFQFSERWNTGLVLSWHPAAILRSNSPDERAQRMRQLVDDLRVARDKKDGSSRTEGG